MMTGVKDAAELYVNLNLTLGFAVVVWFAVKLAFARTRLRARFSVQLGVLKMLLVFVALSPVLSALIIYLQQLLAPERTLAFSDLVVAAYLRGDISLGAIEFEELLNARNGWTEGMLTLSSPVYTAASLAVLAGLVLCMLRFGVAVWRLQRMVQGSHLLKRIGRVDLRVSEAARVPMAVRGLRRRHVVLPYDLESSGRDRGMALAHELQHFRNRDLEWEVALELFRPLFFWNPAFVLLKRQFDHLRELSCDEAVLARRRFAPLDYALCLLRYCERALPNRGSARLNVGLVSGGRLSGRQALARRLLSLSKMEPGRAPLGAVPVLGVLLALGVCFGLFAATIQSPDDWSHDRLMLSTVVNLERLAVINRGF